MALPKPEATRGRNVLQAGRSPIERLRANKLLRTVLLLVALASVLAGFHAASHLSDAGEYSSFSAPLSQDSQDDNVAAHRLDCPGCRLLGAWSFALIPSASPLFHGTFDHGPPPALRKTVPVADAVANWLQRLKHGPPRFPR
jgi:hypothetical protein